MLETRGYRVISALNGEEALDVFRQGGIDLVLSDLVMPRMDGNELIRRMKELAPEVPMIILSGSVKAFDRASHADCFLPKGACTPLEVLERVRMMMARKRGPKKAVSLGSQIADQIETQLPESRRFDESATHALPAFAS